MHASNPANLMRTLPRLIYLVVVYAMLLLSARAATDVSAAPYFQIVSPGDESSTERLPLKSSAAKVGDGRRDALRLSPEDVLRAG